MEKGLNPPSVSAFVSHQPIDIMGDWGNRIAPYRCSVSARYGSWRIRNDDTASCLVTGLPGDGVFQRLLALFGHLPPGPSPELDDQLVLGERANGALDAWLHGVPAAIHPPRLAGDLGIGPVGMVA